MSLIAIREDDLTSRDVLALLEEHLDEMVGITPPESVHALDASGLRSPDVTFWALRDGDVLLGCGALKELDPVHGEIKSMRTANEHLGKGVASRMLEHIIGVARSRRYLRLSLETGSSAEFAPAMSLYRKFGFEFCGPFADYRDDPFSRFMTLELSN